MTCDSHWQDRATIELFGCVWRGVVDWFCVRFGVLLVALWSSSGLAEVSQNFIGNGNRMVLLWVLPAVGYINLCSLPALPDHTSSAVMINVNWLFT